MRVVFMGSPEFAVPTLAEILGAGHEVAAVYCQPPRPAGRGQAERKTAIHTFAESAKLPVATPKSLRSEDEQARFRSLEADVAVVVAYGLLLPKPILDAPRYGCLNLHPSKLPRWRGAAPIQRTIMAGDRDTAVMVMRMDEGLDTGPVCMAEPLAVPPSLTAGELHDLAARRGADLMLRALGALERGTLDCRPQSVEGVTYAAKIDKAEARIDWSESAATVLNRIRAMTPWPGAWFEIEVAGRKERIKVLAAELTEGQGVPGVALDDRLTIACGEGAVRLLKLQRAGKDPLPAPDFIRGFAMPRGARLGAPRG
ncbi:MAG: methionyl-tRNA formyltransferase [Hyphomicrobiaceae bacterium]